MKKLLFIFGTRPETIKFVPIIKEFQKHKNDFDLKICVTGQHRDMLDPLLDFFKIKPDFDLNLMKENQTLFDISSNALNGLEKILNENSPDIIFVQGDTTTAFIGALSGFYKKLKVAHIEAGLRTGNKFAPYPEEINRILIGHIADFHFAPTKKAEENLSIEGINENVWVVGNPVIDTLFITLDMIKKEGERVYYNYFNFIDFHKKIVLVTVHRREIFGASLEDICNSLKDLKNKYNDIEIVYPVHKNPNIRTTVYKMLNDEERIHLIDPLGYPYLIWLMDKSYVILTDSGGIQEEAPSLGKPVLVLREVTERMESIEAGTSKLIGTKKETILNEASLLIEDINKYKNMSCISNPFGDGTSSKQIVEIVKKL